MCHFTAACGTLLVHVCVLSMQADKLEGALERYFGAAQPVTADGTHGLLLYIYTHCIHAVVLYVLG